MRIFRSLYNWLAQRNLGALLGMKWNPEFDPDFQAKQKRQRDDYMGEQALLVTIPKAWAALEQGDYERVATLANRIISDLQGTKSSIARKAIRESQYILSKIPRQVRDIARGSSVAYFNKANSLHKELRIAIEDQKLFRSHLLEIIRLCQLAIELDPLDGDSHIMLASSYMQLAFDGLGTHVYSDCLLKAGASIHKWKSAKLRAVNHNNGEKMHNDIMRHLADNFPSLTPSMLATIHDTHYTSAVDPKGLNALRALVDSIS